MIKKIILIFLLFQINVYCQTKLDFFESVNEYETNTVSVFKDNIKPIKEDFLFNANIFPVYKFEVINNKLMQNSIKNLYYIIYNKRTYFYKNGISNKIMSNDLSNYLSTKQNSETIRIGSFIDYIYYEGAELFALIIDLKNNTLFDLKKEFKHYNDFLIEKYGTIEKYNEAVFLEKTMNKLSSSEIKQSIRNNYKKFEFNCPKDTALVLKTFINQIKESTNTFSKEQEKKLLDKIVVKLNPFQKIYKSATNDESGLRYKELINKAKIDDNDCEKKIVKIIGHYDFVLYNKIITNDLLEILTNKQFQDYKNYIDVRFPIIDIPNLFKSNRYEFGKEILLREKIILKDDVISFENFTNQIIADCGCPIDESKKPKRLRIGE